MGEMTPQGVSEPHGPVTSCTFTTQSKLQEIFDYFSIKLKHNNYLKV